MRGHRDLRLVSVAAIICALIAALVPVDVIRLLAVLPLALFLPGYAVIACAFGARELPSPQRLVLSVATSLMTLVLAAFVLNIFPFGLTTASWAVLLPLVVLAACWGAALRRGQLAGGAGSISLPRPAAGGLVFATLALVIAVAAVALAQKPLPADDAVGFTVLWALPTDSAEDAVAVGVVSNQQHRASYRLKVSLGKHRSEFYRVKLDPGEEKVYEMDLPFKAVGRTLVVASLYREQRPHHLYRQVKSWLPRQKTFP